MLELMIGGTAQGKLAYCMEKHPDAVVCEGMARAFDERDVLFSKQSGEAFVIWKDYHETVKTWLAEGMEPSAAWERTKNWILANKNAVIISDEIGNGIVPMDGGERRWREETGRLLCRIARESNVVERICCGLPMRIK